LLPSFRATTIRRNLYFTMHALSTAAFISVLALASTLARAMPQGVSSITSVGAEPTSSPLAPCTVVYIVPKDETCDTIAAELGLSKADILSFNPSVSCDDTIPAGRVLCTKRG
ncbi:hypothetical protein EDB86DRAFT_2955919, partial [Lactarius hatsudake]